MNLTLTAIIVTLASMLTSAMVFPLALRFAQKNGIVDQPNARKLQRVPVPVFGGVVVYSGILVGGIVLQLFYQSPMLALILFATMIMMMIGTWDDIKGLPVVVRLLVEVLLVAGFIATTGIYIDNFHGLWGVYQLDPWWAIPFSIFAGVGTINAINMIDGVDGYSSGYAMLACLCFAIVFHAVWTPGMVCLTMISGGALLPFFMHNVFGTRSRMFIGDGGTLMLGMLLTVLAFSSLSSQVGLGGLEEYGICIPAFTLAVGCIPIFDALRVMITRMIHGKSPLKADKSHLHHLFIDMGFSHLGAAMFILQLNILVLLGWLLSWYLGASLDMQLYVVIAMALLVTVGVYCLLRAHQNGGRVDEEGYPTGTLLWHFFCRIGEWTHKEDKRAWRIMQLLMDYPFLSRILKFK
jgi:UDP-N-acetylmuramyl pentapeptide phosphotransferase/UDP-N-acetylglucosamine-1-phosphate transferase